MKGCSEYHAPHDIEIDAQSEADEPYCAICGHEIDLTWRHTDELSLEEMELEDQIRNGHCESIDAEHWRDGDVCGMCGGEWVEPQ